MDPAAIVSVGTALLCIISEAMALSRHSKCNSIVEFLFCALELLKNTGESGGSEGTAVVAEDKN